MVNITHEYDEDEEPLYPPLLDDEAEVSGTPYEEDLDKKD